MTCIESPFVSMRARRRLSDTVVKERASHRREPLQ
jgi:hypothetical protein